MRKKKSTRRVYDYDKRPKNWEKDGYRWDGEHWSTRCICHDLPWAEHDKILIGDRKEWAK